MYNGMVMWISFWLLFGWEGISGFYFMWYDITLTFQNAPKVSKKGYMNLNLSTDEEDNGKQKKGEDDDDEEEEDDPEPESAYEDDSDFEES